MNECETVNTCCISESWLYLHDFNVCFLMLELQSRMWEVTDVWQFPKRA